MLKDSGNRTEFKSGAVRDIQEGKGRCDLLPLTVIGCWCEDSAYDILGCIDLYRLRPSTVGMSAILNKFAYKHRDANDTCKGLERYRWDLVLEVAKHFEEGAKKYGDRNWEKGIPCDRYIDSAVRHYCKWSAGWTDEPHDRAFIWNILCCEWTRQRYGWNLERLNEKDDHNSSFKEFLDKMGGGDFRTRCLNLNRYFSYSFDPDDKSDVKATPGDYNDIRLNDFTELTGTIKRDLGIEKPIEKDKATADLKAACNDIERHNACLNENCIDRSCSECKYYTDPDAVQKAVDILLDHAEKSLNGREQEKPKRKDQDSAELKEACDVVGRYNTCYNAPTSVCLHKNCSECEHHVDDCDLHKAVIQLYDHVKTSLNGNEEVNNRYIRNVTGGVELYDYAGNFVGYVHGFRGVKSEADIRSIVEKSWGLLTLNPFTLEKIVEDHGYIADIHFIVEMYKNPGDIKLPDDWQLVKRKTKEDSK